MKNQNKGSKDKGTISQLVLGLIKAKGLHKPGRSPKADGVAIIAQVKRSFPGSKFSQAHYAWYLSRYRKQVAEGLGTDKLHFGKQAKAAQRKAASKKKSPKARAKSSRRQAEVTE